METISKVTVFILIAMSIAIALEMVIRVLEIIF
jgi:hypothetical protein